MSSDYSALDRVFHRIVLNGSMLGEMLGDFDGSFAKGAATTRNPVFVTGLARAGTTALMRALHGTGQFASLTYADMPMVMAPNLWARLSGAARKERVSRERAHGDGVMVDFDAPEALEEVFWRTHCGTDYIQPDALVPHAPDPDVIAAYRDYQNRVCHRHGAPRYLAKNNNMMLRLGPLATDMADARILVPVRDPVAQALSLLRQHTHFGSADSFTEAYMRWLVHHEFGADQRPFILPGQPEPQGPRDRLDYWLTEWVAAYGWLSDAIAAHPETIRPVIYETLGPDPAAWAQVCRFVGIPEDTPADLRPAPPPTVPEGIDPVLLERARGLYADLATRAAADQAGPLTPAAP